MSGTLGAAYRTGIFRSTPLAYLNPVAPSAWLLHEVDRAAAEHTRRFLRHCEHGGATLVDLNLDTGRPLSSERGHATTRRTLEELARLAA